MISAQQGAFRIWRAAGISVFLHWSWFLVAVIEVRDRAGSYSSMLWNVAEYLALFGIVLMHEFGHALACRSVGGRADKIVLWPLGGVAYVDPPQRPGPVLWSIAAGPLVNVVLFPVFLGLALLSRSQGWAETMPDLHALLRAVFYINFGLLIFNLAPVYPLDGGQILRALLWFVVGRGRSLMVAAIIGFIGVALLVAWAVANQSIWLGVIAAFVLMNCWGGMKQALALMRLAKLPRHSGNACPSCKTAPPIGELWLCCGCQKPFDIFAADGQCAQCGAPHDVATCPDCGQSQPLTDWASNSPPIPG